MAAKDNEGSLDCKRSEACRRWASCTPRANVRFQHTNTPQRRDFSLSYEEHSNTSEFNEAEGKGLAARPFGKRNFSLKNRRHKNIADIRKRESTMLSKPHHSSASSVVWSETCLSHHAILRKSMRPGQMTDVCLRETTGRRRETQSIPVMAFTQGITMAIQH